LISREILPRKFYSRDPELVARGLLGKTLIRKVRENVMEGTIVETEAYYGLEDPASRAYHGIKNYNRSMWGDPGTAFIYNVHRYWMFNVVAHDPGKVGAVLIRALEPKKGINAMKLNRQVKQVYSLTNGPGKLTVALKIDKSLNGVEVTSTDSQVTIVNNKTRFIIKSSNRIGVAEDLERELRFFIKENSFVSE
jgi:DNA-3-methyladenine glycosylase